MVKISVGIRNVKFVLILSFLAGVKKEEAVEVKAFIFVPFLNN